MRVIRAVVTTVVEVATAPFRLVARIFGGAGGRGARGGRRRRRL